MQVTVFTGTGLRHTALLERVSEVAGKVYAVRECAGFGSLFGRSDVKNEYFSRVDAAERAIFGSLRPVDVETMPIAAGELSRLRPVDLRRVLSSDVFLVFGSSWIKGWLCDLLVEARTLNLHAGVSPEYRGAGTNFWAEYDGRSELVGATVHLLTRGLDDGDIVDVSRDIGSDLDPFTRGMLAIDVGLDSLVRAAISYTSTEPQDRSQEIRYARKADFTDDVVAEYLARLDLRQEVLA